MLLVVRMDIIAKSNDVEIYAEKEWEFSFFASPYHAHREFGAVDIYQGRDFGDIAISPVNGRVFKIMKFESPSLGKALPEYLILIKNGSYLVRIMHIEPSVREGDKIHVGDEIGKFINNGYFYFWSDANIHVEVRDLNNYLRARGGYELMPTFTNKIDGKTSVSELEGVVVNVSKRNITIKLNKNNVVKIWNEYALMDCATPLGYGGILGKFKLGDEIYFNGIKIGKIDNVGNYMSTFKTEKLMVFANDIEFSGISFIFGRRVMRLLPKRYGRHVLRKGDRVKIKLEGKRNETRQL